MLIEAGDCRLTVDKPQVLRKVTIDMMSTHQWNDNPLFPQDTLF